MSVLNVLKGKFKPRVAVSERLDALGHEKLDDTPLAVPLGFQRPPTLAEQVARLVRSERFKESLEDEDLETFEEADDFDIPDDPVDPTTPYEEDFDHAIISAVDKGVVRPVDLSAAKEAQSRLDKHPRKKSVDKFEEEIPNKGSKKAIEGVSPSGEDKK